jgi:hypothetical protein
MSSIFSHLFPIMMGFRSASSSTASTMWAGSPIWRTAIYP